MERNGRVWLMSSDGVYGAKRCASVSAIESGTRSEILSESLSATVSVTLTSTLIARGSLNARPPLI